MYIFMYCIMCMKCNILYSFCQYLFRTFCDIFGHYVQIDSLPKLWFQDDLLRLRFRMTWCAAQSLTTATCSHHSHFYLSFWLLTFNFWSLIILATAPPRLPRHCMPRNNKREGFGMTGNSLCEERQRRSNPEGRVELPDCVA